MFQFIVVLTMHMCALCQFKSCNLDWLSWAHSQSKYRISGHNHLFLFGVVECYKSHDFTLHIFYTFYWLYGKSYTRRHIKENRYLLSLFVHQYYVITKKHRQIMLPILVYHTHLWKAVIAIKDVCFEEHSQCQVVSGICLNSSVVM